MQNEKDFWNVNEELEELIELDSISKNKLLQKEYHEYANLFPMLSTEELNLLADDIKENGLINNIVLFENKIIDGRNRYEACKLADVEPKFELLNTNKPLEYVISTNLKRRHLTIGQKSLIAAAIANMKSGERTDLEPKPNLAEVKISIEQAARIMGVSTGSVKAAKEVKDNYPDRVKEIEEGKIAVSAVVKEEKTKQNKIRKQEYAEKGKELIIKNELIDIRLGDFSKVLSDIPDNSIDLILTDPPYPYEFIECWTKLGEFAQSKLKDGGFLIAYSGHIWLPEVINRVLNSGMNWYWIGVCLHGKMESGIYGLSSVFETNVFAKHKPILFFYKGNKLKQKNWFMDVFESNNIETKDFHIWGQSVDVFDKLIKIFEPSIVVDPFLGGGTTAISCIDNNVKFVGAEIDETSFNITKKRIDDYEK